MKRLLFFTVIILMSLPPIVSTARAGESVECVILLHGLGRTSYSMNKIEDGLTRDGYHVWNETYPSTKEKIETLAVRHIKTGLSFCEAFGPAKIHFVTHSLGGILVRYYLQTRRIPDLGNIVMLSPPNKGSELADHLKDIYFYKILTGPAGQQLGTDSDSIIKQIKPIKGHIGIITGDRSLDPWFSTIIPGEDDGKVSIESAKLAEMSDFLVVDSGHTFIMRSETVIDQVKYFLKNGKFMKEQPAADD